ncbi:hypothetical protein E3N88_44029 [Mikania micrantha]|uniref:Photosystem I reaction center subunit II, chloroplastic n=1 Tax=Mikania micrantha TaxID=192012 RepID=A0A5N6LDD5_9ASTR|nr:hypothetical protein E3N88_44029 [Mikania micrantha]
MAKEQIFEMPTGGAAIMREGPNLLKLARKEQCLALDGVYPEKVNTGREGVGQNMRSIGKIASPVEVKFTGKQPYDL